MKGAAHARGVEARVFPRLGKERKKRVVKGR